MVRDMTTETKMPASLFIERFLKVITALGLASLCIGLIVHVVGRISDNLTVAQVGAYILLFGIVLISIKILSWILEKIVERGSESLAK